MFPGISAPLIGNADTNFKIGADPELFAISMSMNANGIPEGQPLSGHDLIPGTKEEPHKVKGGAVQVDGVALEFNVNPTDDGDQFLRNIRYVIRTMNWLAKSKNQFIRIAAVPTAMFPKDYFDKLPDQAKMLGCSPDYNAYTGEEQHPPATEEPFRTGGGHIHVGWGEGFNPFIPEHFNDCIKMTRQLDAALFVPSMIWDGDRKRRTLYGKMGSFRPKPYGVEYRPLSNAWVGDVELQEWTFYAAKTAAETLDAGMHLYMDKHLGKYLQRLNAFPDETFTSKELKEYVATLKDFDFPSFPQKYLDVL